MEATVATVLTDQLTAFKDGALAQFGTMLPIALGLVITVGVAFVAIKYFRAIANV